MPTDKIIKPDKKERVLITGNAGALGHLITKSLIKSKRYEIFGVDKRPLSINKTDCFQHYQLDLRRKSAFDLLRKIKPESIIHLGVIRNPQIHRQKRENAYYFNLESTTQLLRLAESLRIRKFVFLSSANLYGPSANTSGLLSEDFPLHGANKSPELRDLVALDMMVQSFFWKQPKTETIILRPCNIVGPHLNNAPSRYLQLDTIPYILGFDPMLQLLHEADLVAAIMLALKSHVRGIFNLASKETAPLSRIISSLGRAKVGVPETIFRLFLQGAFIGRQSSFPSYELDHLKYSCLIDDTRACLELGFKPKKNLSSIIKDLKKSAS